MPLLPDSIRYSDTLEKTEGYKIACSVEVLGSPLFDSCATGEKHGARLVTPTFREVCFHDALMEALRDKEAREIKEQVGACRRFMRWRSALVFRRARAVSTVAGSNYRRPLPATIPSKPVLTSRVGPVRIAPNLARHCIDESDHQSADRGHRSSAEEILSRGVIRNQFMASVRTRTRGSPAQAPAAGAARPSCGAVLIGCQLSQFEVLKLCLCVGRHVVNRSDCGPRDLEHAIRVRILVRIKALRQHYRVGLVAKEVSHRLDYEHRGRPDARRVRTGPSRPRAGVSPHYPYHTNECGWRRSRQWRFERLVRPRHMLARVPAFEFTQH
jgi:hypothetical protein